MFPKFQLEIWVFLQKELENFKKRILIALNSEKGWGEPFSAYLLKTKKR
jgi:hypothetical protein